MKKHYDIPTIRIVHLCPSDIVATSPGISGQSSDGNSFNLGRERYFDEDDAW